MFDNRSLRGDISLVGLIALIIFLTVSLFTYDPADRAAELAAPLNQYYQPSGLVFPSNEIPSNACGTIGATTADLLFSNLGFGAFYLLAGLATLAVALVRTKHTLSPWLRTFGWALSLVGVTCLASLLFTDLTPGPITGPGGYLGLLSVNMLRSHFAIFGSSLIAVGVTIVGLLLWTDYLALRLGHWVLAGVFGAAAVGYQRHRQSAKARKRVSDLDIDALEEDEVEGEEENHTIKIRVGGKPADIDAEELEDEEWEDEFEEDEEDEYEYEDDDEDGEVDGELDETDDELDNTEVDSPVTFPVVVKQAAKKSDLGLQIQTHQS